MRRLRASHVVVLAVLLIIGSILRTTTAQAEPNTPQTAVLGGFYGPAGGSPDNARAYATEQDPDGWLRLRVIDTSNGGTIAVIPIANTAPWPTYWYSTGGIAADVVVSPDGSRVYVTNENQVTVVDATTNTVIANIVSPVHANQSGITSGPTNRMVLSPDGSTLYVAQTGAVYPLMEGSANYPGDLIQIDTATDTITNITTTHAVNLQDLVLTADGQGLYVDELYLGVEHYDVSVTPPVDRGTLPLPDIGQPNAGFLFTAPSGDTLYAGFYVTGGIQFSTVDTSTDTVTATSPVLSGDGTPIGLSGDGGTLYFLAQIGRFQPFQDVVNEVSTSDFALAATDSTALAGMSGLCAPCSAVSPDGSTLYVLGTSPQLDQFWLRIVGL